MKDAILTNSAEALPLPAPGLSAEQQDAMHLIRQEGKVLYPEAVLRISLMVAVGFVLMTYTGQPVLLLLLGGHALVNIGYLIWLGRLSAPFSRAAYAMSLAMSIFLKLWFSAVALYLVTLNDPVLTITGIASIAGLSLHIIIVCGKVRPLAIFSAVLIVVLVGATAAVTIYRTDTMSGVVLLLISFASVSAYYVFTLHEFHTSHHRIREAEARAAEAQKMQAIGQMTRGIARDFNNLLTGIQGNLELTRHLNDGADREEALERARTAARRASTLTTQLVAYARQSPLRPAPQDVKDLMGRIANRIKEALPPQHSLILDPIAQMDPVKLDPEQLARVLTALTTNAAEASPEGAEITLRVRLVGLSTPITRIGKSGLGPGTYCAISVLDTGPGIAPDLLDKVTEPFFTTSQSRRNSGLGLPMSLGFAEQSGGALSIASQPGRTEVTLYLPCPDCNDFAK